MTTPNMGLDLPSPLVTLGPTWAQLLNDALDVIDAHDHTAGNGAPIGTAALNIDGDVDFSGYALDNLGRAALVNLGAAETTPRSLYSFGGELYYTDASGNPVQLTIGGSAAGGGGSIDGLISPASAFYNSGAQSFEWSVNATLRADLDFGRALFRQNNAASGAAITLGAPTSGVSAYSITLPPAAPTGGTTRLVSSPAGSSAALAWISTDGSSIEISGSTLQVKALGISTAKLADSAVTTAKIADVNVTTGKLADLGVTTAKLADLGVTTGKIADAAVTTAKLADLNVTTGKINDLAVTAVKLGSSSVTNLKIADGAVTTAKIADLNVTTAKLADLGVTTGKLADLAVTVGKIAAGAVGATQIFDGAIITSKIFAQAVSSDKIAAQAVVESKIASDAVTSLKIANGAVTTAKIGDSQVTAAKLATDSVTTVKILDRSVTLSKRDYSFKKFRTGVGTQYGGTLTFINMNANRIVCDADNLGLLHYGLDVFPGSPGGMEFYVFLKDGEAFIVDIILELCRQPIGGGAETIVSTHTWTVGANNISGSQAIVQRIPLFSTVGEATTAGEYYLKLRMDTVTDTGPDSNIRYEYVSAYIGRG